MSATIQNSNYELVAKRWAKALMDLALEDNQISKEEILDDLKEISHTIDSSKELQEVFENPAISVEEKQIVIAKLFQNNIMPIVYNFIFALNLKKRLAIIPQVAVEFEKELEKFNNTVRAHITSAIEINEERKNEIKNKIEEKFNKNIIIDWGIDNDIIAGLIFNIDENIIDSSVRHKLEDIGKKIKA